MTEVKTVVISGGSSGLGKAIAKQLATNYKVIILARDETELNNAANDIGCDKYVCDVGDWQQVGETVKSITERYGQIDVLINNAGLWIQGPLDQNDWQKIDEVIRVNVLGVMYLSKAVIPKMKEQKTGWIINISSQAGISAKAERTVYYASKWAVTGFTKCLQPELAPHGIKVTGIYPGMMKTSLFKKAGIDKNLEKGINTEDIARVVEFILTFDNEVTFPELGIKHIED